MVYAIDAETGALLWERVAHEGKPFGGRHRKNTYASETPATDGERLFVYFGNVGLFAYSLDGELEWEHRFPPRPIYLDFGTAASPAVDSERVYVQCDNQEESFLAAVDKRTGKELWQIARGVGNKGMIRSGWSTPFLWATPARNEIVALGHGLAISYDVDGKELWRLSGLTGQATPTAIANDGLLYQEPGLKGNPTGRCSRFVPAPPEIFPSPKGAIPTSSWRGTTLRPPLTPRRHSPTAAGSTS